MQKYLSHELVLDPQGGCRRALTWQVVEELGQATNRESVSDTSIRLAKLGNISVRRSSAARRRQLGPTSYNMAEPRDFIRLHPTITKLSLPHNHRKGDTKVVLVFSVFKIGIRHNSSN